VDELHISELEVNHLILMVTNYGASEVLECVKRIADGMLETQRSVVSTGGNDNRLRMWDEISKAISPVVAKVDRIERRYKGMEASRKFMMDAIQNVAKQQA
jgi:hypothetical protein